LCRYCCKSPKLPGDDFPVVSRSDRRTANCAASITLPRSPVSLSVSDEVPHIFTRKSRLQPGKFLITSAKRLLQHYLPETDSCTPANRIVTRHGRICQTVVVRAVPAAVADLKFDGVVAKRSDFSCQARSRFSRCGGCT
jgi:hypothetical protein